MKKLLACFCVFSLCLCFTSSVMAGGAVNKTNWSVEYVRTFNRNAATDAADIALYNPAGTTKMEEGLYGNLSAHYIMKDYSNNFDAWNAVEGAWQEDRSQDEPSIIPGIFMVYNKNQWAFFGGISNHGGGGKVDFSDGSLTTRKLGYAMWNPLLAPITGGPGPISGERIEAESKYIGYSFGAAYEISKMFSVSLGAKYIDASRNADIKATVTNAANPTGFTEKAAYEELADGLGGVIGLNISPTEDLNIGIRYETNVKLKFKQTVSEDSRGLVPYIGPQLGVTDGGTVQKDLPAIGAVGVSYRFLKKFRVEADLTWYFNENAKNEDWIRTNADVDDGYDIGIMLEYMFTDKLLASIGYLHTKVGFQPEDMTPEAPELDADTIGGGVAWKPGEAWTLNFSVGNSFYKKESFVYAPSPLIDDCIEYEKNNLFLGLGLEYKFF